MNFKSLYLIVISFFCATPIYADQLDELLDKESQVRLGLDKLNEGQRQGIYDLVNRAYDIGKQEGLKSAKREQTPTPSVIESQIDGDFEGWEGETIVKLMNGQIWQQTEYYYEYHYAYAPSVTVFKSRYGGYQMKVDGIDKAVGVQRLN